MLEDILTDHNAHIDHRANGNGDAGERDDIGVDREQFHRRETQQYRQGQQAGDQRGPAQIQHHRQYHHYRHKNFLAQRNL